MTDEAQPSFSDERRELMMAEYKTLRDETLKRMDHRITLLVSSLTVDGAILGIGVERASGPLLLLTPVIAVLFGFLVMYHTKAISDIARYLMTAIEEPLNERYPGSFGWHTVPWRTTRFREIFSIFHFPTMLTTVVPAITAMTLAWQFRVDTTVMVLLSVLDAVLMVYYLVAYFRRVAKPLLRAGDAKTRAEPSSG